MRILHVNKYLYRRGGAEGYMLDVARLQREAGHEVELFGMQHPENPAGLPLADTFPGLVELEPAPEGLRAKAAAAARMLWSTSSRSGLSEAIRRFRPDVVHLHNVYHQLSPSVLHAVRDAGLPSVMTLHDYKLACPSYQMLDHGKPCDACVTGSPVQAARRRCKDGSLTASTLLAVESTLHRATRAYAPVTALVCPSEFLAGVMRQAGVFPERLHVVPHFVAPSDAALPASPGLGFVFGGRLSHEKGVDTLVRAVGLAPDVHLDVAGDGPERAALEALAAQCAPGRVRFHGRIARDELETLMRGSLAGVVPSRWYENQPMTVLESMGAGVPVVATTLGGLPELVRDGVDGWTVPPDDPQALATILQAVAADPAEARRRGAVGRERMLRDFSADVHVERLDELYRECRAVVARTSTTTAVTA
ncbi:glycosyltransferase involved in cell wall biosynthesis [Terracoccus luteus]|uniref:Glycosyltransferase involved in cell wall biosynthesis n=1 Tax=Terracoccus luteus TaxID=53356 RepID=A0A495XV69_9MICO|nr:glycosyltransferase family 4 protein [Terracoccus luteus]RKT78460.1 glycosyltransferase involved in cell wall biosynthesis [Terracoccus luteus]